MFRNAYTLLKVYCLYIKLLTLKCHNHKIILLVYEIDFL